VEKCYLLPLLLNDRLLLLAPVFFPPFFVIASERSLAIWLDDHLTPMRPPLSSGQTDALRGWTGRPWNI